MPFIDVNRLTPIDIAPGCRIRTPYGKNVMLSYLEMDEGAQVPLHSHPHEQAGMLLEGKLALTIGDVTEVVEGLGTPRTARPLLFFLAGFSKF